MPPADVAVTEFLPRHAEPQARERDPERPLWWAAYTAAWLVVAILAALLAAAVRIDMMLS